jgi:hypothetical protein
VNTRRRIKKAEYDKLAAEALFTGKVQDRLNAIKSKGSLEELDHLAERLVDTINDLFKHEQQGKTE